jgi:hypothetical protein
LDLLKSYFPAVADRRGNASWRLTVHGAIYFLLLVVLAGSQSVSNFFMSGMEILLAVNWALEWDMRAKWDRARRSPLLWAFLVLMAVHLLWMLGSANTAYGWGDIFRKLPLLAIPLVVLTSRPLNRKQLTALLFAFVATVFVATVIGRIRLAVIPDLPYRQIVPFISHIRFAMNVCLALVVIGWGIFYFDDNNRMIRFFEIAFGQVGSLHDFVTITALTDNCWLWVVCMLFCMPIRSGVEDLLQRWTTDGSALHGTVMLCSRLLISVVLLVLSVSLLVGATNNAFIYTRF